MSPIWGTNLKKSAIMSIAAPSSSPLGTELLERAQSHARIVLPLGKASRLLGKDGDDRSPCACIFTIGEEARTRYDGGRGGSGKGGETDPQGSQVSGRGGADSTGAPPAFRLSRIREALEAE